ncbi:MAG: hypothetical protein KAH24_05195 [Holophagae bacterium]|nr:hypothetical protein [Holophagae bacterium]
MDKIESKFNEQFQHWQIHLPAEDIKFRQYGAISEWGWEIRYLFGSDGTGDYLDYYATHRMTNDRHVRIYDNGTCESLPTMGQCCLLSDDPKESARLQKEFDERNLQVAEMLKAKGF